MVKKELDMITIQLKGIAKRNSVPLEEVQTKYKEKLEELAKQGQKVNLERIAVSAVMNEYRKQKNYQNRQTTRIKKEVTTIHGFIVGDRGVWDKAENIRKAAKRYIDKNGMEAAIEAQLIDGDGNILDTRQKIYGRENPKYLEPLDPNLHVKERTMYGFFLGTDGKYKYGSIQTNDNRLASGWSKVKFYVPCSVPAIMKEETDIDIKLSSSSAVDTLSIFKAEKEDIDIKAVIDEYCKDKWTEISKVEEFHIKYKDAWDRHIFVKGVVAWIGIDRPTPIGTIKMGLMNPQNEDELVIVEIPEHIPIDFGELSEIYVFGTTRQTKVYDDERKLVEGPVNILATGIFPTIAIPRERTINSKEDTPIEGWID